MRVTYLNSSNSPGGPGSTTPWVIDSAVATSAFANDVRYVPMRHSNSDYIMFQFASAKTGPINISFRYAMSSSEANNIRLRADSYVLSTGGNPSTALTTGTAFTLSATNDVLLHELTSSSSSDLTISVSAGDILVFKLTRLGSDGADTHTGDMRIVEVRMV